MIRLQTFTDRLVDEFCEFSGKYYTNYQTTDRDFVRWKFPKEGRFFAKYVTCETNGAVVGREVLCARPLSFNGTEFTITQPSDLLIDPENSSAACLLQLVRAFPRLETSGLIHTSNEKSEPVYSRLFKFPIITQLKSVGIPINVENILPRTRLILPLRAIFWLVSLVIHMAYGLVAGLMKMFTSDFDISGGAVNSDGSNLYEQFRWVAPKQITRDPAFVNWRYVESPEAYQELIAKRDDVVVAKVIYRMSEVEGLTALTIMDWLVARKLTLAERMILIACLRRIARDQDAGLVYGLGNFNNPMIRHTYGAGFVKIPDRFLPHGSPIFAHGFTEPLSGDALQDMYLSLGDLDYF